MGCSDAEKKAIKEKLEKLAEENNAKINYLVENPENLEEEIEKLKKNLDSKTKDFIEENKGLNTEEGIKNFLQNIMNNPNNNDDDKKKLEDSLKALTYCLALKHTKNTKPDNTRTGNFMRATESSANKKTGGASTETEKDKKCKNFKNLDETNSTKYQRTGLWLGNISLGGIVVWSAFSAISLASAGVASPLLATCFCLAVSCNALNLQQKFSQKTCEKHYRYSLIYDLKESEKTNKQIIVELIKAGFSEEIAKISIDNYDKNHALTQSIKEQKKRQQTVGGDSSGDSSSDSSSDTSLLDEKSLKEICDKLNTVVLPNLTKETQEKIKAELEAGPEDKKLSIYEKFMKKTEEFEKARKNVGKELNNAEKYLPNGGKKKRKTTKKGKKKTRKSKKIKKKTKKVKRKVRKTRKSRK